MQNDQADLDIREIAGGRVETQETGYWRLSLPAGPAGQYRLAQLDDYSYIHRRDFRWQSPVRLSLRARASHPDLPGTWGFGLWNDPFITDFGFAGGTRRLPVLPDAAWFFFASAENYLTLNDEIPASGALAATFHSRRVPSLALALAIPVIPFFFIGPVARVLRRAGRKFVQQDAEDLRQVPTVEDFDVSNWQTYTLELSPNQAQFFVNRNLGFATGIVPTGPLGVVIWIDNQYAALPPGGGLSFGTLENPDEAWIEITDLQISQG